MLGITIKALHTMTTTTKDRTYYREVLMTPCYLMRQKLEEDYQLFIDFGLHTAGIIALIAEHLTAYNELVSTPLFFRMRDFNPNK